jgi:hypothetical protein
MWVTGETAGPRCTSSTRPTFTDWRWRRVPAGARCHAVAEEGVPFRDVAEAIGRGLKMPVVSKSAEEAAQHFGFLGAFRSLDCPASSALTRQRLGWRPTQSTGMIADLNHPSAFAV